MRNLLLLCILLFMIGCSDKENALNMIKQEEAERMAETSNSHYSQLPLGLNFEMNKHEVDSVISELISDGIISKSGNYYEYKYILDTGQEIDTWVNFDYYNGKLYYLSFELLGDPNEEIISLLDRELSEKLDSTYKRISYYEKHEKYDGEFQKFIFTKWFKENQIIFMRHALGSDLSYINAPVYKLITDIRMDKALEKTRNSRDEKGNIIRVQNSILDGSVIQVERYLKNSLKDPDSYQSIEWGKVLETSEGYLVRHKYRAKNSFGGYVIENNTFYLNTKGEIINIVPYK